MVSMTAPVKLADVNAIGFGAHLGNYLSSTDGATDLCLAIDTAVQHLQALPLSPAQQGVLEGVGKSASDGFLLLGLPDAITGSIKFYKQASGLIELIREPGDDSKYGKVQGAAKGLLLQGAAVAYSSTKVASLIQNKKWADLNAPLISGVNNLSSLVMDSFDLFDQASKIYTIRQERAEATQGQRQVAPEVVEREWICMVNLVKDVASVVLSVLILALLVFDVVAESVAILPPTILALTTIYLTAKLYAYFYERLFEDARAEALALP